MSNLDLDRGHRFLRAENLSLALRFMRQNYSFTLGLAVLAFILVMALAAPLIAPYQPAQINFADRLVPPSLVHLMGTNELGQDIFSQVVYGARTSLFIGVIVVVFATAIGVPIGAICGYFGGKTDTLLMRISDVFLAFPPLLLPIALAAALGTGLLNAAFALAICWFPWYARITRGAVIRIKNELYISAARAMGISHWRTLTRHALPNASTPIIVQASMDFGYAILAAASLSFIGIGAQPPDVEWGLMAAMSRTRFLDAWWTVTFPGLAIFVTVMAINLVGDGVRDILDPQQRSSL